MSELRERSPVPNIGEPAQPLQREGEGAQQPKYDNFYTPKNHEFYSKFQYANLDRMGRRIRLLRIHPPIPADNTSAMVACDFLDDISMKQTIGRYTTLSYCAGDPQNTEVILVNGVEFNAFANLGHALRQARLFWKDKFEDHELLLWADQVCIDQSNSLERTHQVEMMGDIYASAEQVLICLSKEGDPTGGIEWLRGVPDDIIRRHKATVDNEQIQEHNGSQNTKSAVDKYINSFRDKYLDKYFHSRWGEKDFHLGWHAFLKTILGSRWWSRVWVRQEFLRSQQAVFIASSEAIPWEPFANFIEFYTSFVFRVENTLSEFHQGESANARRINPCKACALGKSPYMYRAKGRRAHELLAWKRRRVSEPGQFLDLLDNLKGAFHCEASDPRDLIYAYLGLSDHHYNIIPEYSPGVSFEDISRQLTINVISHNNNLDILEMACRTDYANRSLDLPSWTPDWRQESPDGLGHFNKKIFLNQMTLAKQGSRTKGFLDLTSISSISFQPDLDGRKDRILQVQGIFYDVFQKEIRNWPRTFSTATDNQLPAVGRPEKGDQAWLLHGYNNLLVLRRKGEYYELVGEILSDDGMLPEAPALIEGLALLISTNNPLVRTIKIC